MIRHRFTRVHRPEETPLTAEERRHFRQVRRGLRATDPSWYAFHCPRSHRRRRLARHAAAMLSLALVLLGALTGVMPVVLCGVVVALAVTTSHISARRIRPHSIG
jgi:predicted alpha/beta hydrolase